MLEIITPTSPVPFEQLIPTHNELRNPKNVNKFLKMLKKGERFRGISLVEFTDVPLKEHGYIDEKYFIHDGHHRTIAKILYGEELQADEYNITRCPLEYYTIPNVVAGWCTPFNPVAEVRVPEFFDFKDIAMGVHGYGGEEEANEFIQRCFHVYSEPREVFTIKDLGEKYDF